MLSIFFVIFGSIGIFLNWPVIEKGIFVFLTQPLGNSQVLATIKGYCAGFYRLDGTIIIVISLLILMSAFIRTSKAILNLRRILLVVTTAIISAELFTVIQAGFSFHRFTGLMYSSIFYLLGLVAATFKIGSMKSFNSTFAGKPMSESKAFSQTFSQVINNVSRSLKIECQARDNIDTDWRKGQTREFSEHEINIGRDRNWADLTVGPEWDTVSKQHGIIRVIGNSMIYEPISSHYAYALDGKPFSVPKEIPNQSRLSLVSGLGPEFTVGYEFKKNPVLHPKTMFRAGEIARDEFKRLQSTFKILIVLVILALPLLWVFTGVQKKVMGDYIDGIKNQNQEFTLELKGKMDRIGKLDLENQDNQKEINRLKSRISQLKHYGAGNGEELDNSQSQIEKIKKRAAGSKIGIQTKRLAKIIDIKLSSQRISVYFPCLTFFGESRARSGSGFFVKGRGGRISLVTEKAMVIGNSSRKNTRTYLFVYPDSWKIFQQYHSSLIQRRQSVTVLHQQLKKNSSRYNLMVLDGRKWRSFGREFSGNAIVAASIKNFPDYLLPYVPKADTAVSRSDRVIVYGFQSGKKTYSVGNIIKIARNMVRVQPAVRLKVSGGLLLKVLPNGNYAAVGVVHSGGVKGPGSGIPFLRF